MIEIIRIDGQPVRVTGFRTLTGTDQPVFDVVIQIPGEAANREFAQLTGKSSHELTICHPDGSEASHRVMIAAHAVHRAGPDHAPLFRHQFRFEQLDQSLQPAALSGIESELAEILVRLDRLLNALDDAGVISREAVERQVRAGRAGNGTEPESGDSGSVPYRLN